MKALPSNVVQHSLFCKNTEKHSKRQIVDRQFYFLVMVRYLSRYSDRIDKIFDFSTSCWSVIAKRDDEIGNLLHSSLPVPLGKTLFRMAHTDVFPVQLVIRPPWWFWKMSFMSNIQIFCIARSGFCRDPKR